MKKKLRILSIIVFGLFIIGLFSFNTSSVDETQKDALYIDEVFMKENDVLKIPTSASLGYEYSFKIKSLQIEKPLLIKAIEQEPQEYDKFEDNALGTVNDNNLFNYPKKTGFGYWGIGFSGSIDFFKRIINTKAGREVLFQILEQYYQSISNELPVSSKKRLVNRCEELINFLRTKINNYPIHFNKSRNDYEFVNEKHSYELEYMEGFILRRNKVDKVPVAEITEYLTKFKNLISSSIEISKFRNYFNIRINNKIVIRDLDDYHNEIYSLSSKKSIKLNVVDNSYRIKLLTDKGKEYYKLEKNVRHLTNVYDLVALYDKDLNKIM